MAGQNTLRISKYFGGRSGASSMKIMVFFQAFFNLSENFSDFTNASNSSKKAIRTSLEVVAAKKVDGNGCSNFFASSYMSPRLQAVSGLLVPQAFMTNLSRLPKESLRKFLRLFQHVTILKSNCKFKAFSAIMKSKVVFPVPGPPSTK